MAYPTWQPYYGYQQPMQDQLAQLRSTQYTQQPQYTQQTQYNAQNVNGIIWVQGEEAAKAYLVAPNTTTQLWDSENPTIYLKSADGSGMPTMRILDYTERITNRAPRQEVLPTSTDYVTREEFDALKAKIEGITTTPKKSKKEEE